MAKYTAGVEGGDGLKRLQPGDDPATADWGETSTFDEIKELLMRQNASGHGTLPRKVTQ